MVEAGPLKQKVYLARENPPRFAPEGDSSSSRGRSQGMSQGFPSAENPEGERDLSGTPPD